MKITRINIHFPPVMNLFHTTTLEIKGTPSLSTIKFDVYKKFSQDFAAMWGSSMQARPSFETLTLKGKDVVICCEEKLKSLENSNIEFEAYFGNDPDAYSKALERFHTEFV